MNREKLASEAERFEENGMRPQRIREKAGKYSSYMNQIHFILLSIGVSELNV
jgi:hypothetical protein